MKILVSGATGFLGSALVPALQQDGHEVWSLSRRPGPRTIVWDLAAGSLDPAHLDGFGAVVHLAGENIAGRWTDAKKRAIHDSRVQGTRLLAEACARTSAPPSVFVMASAAGIYGSRGDEVLTEDSPPGTGFLANVVRDWEAAAAPAEEHPAIRVVKLRFGVILDPSGGALKQMLLPFRLGLGGRVGSGRQWISWLTRDDAVRLLVRAVTENSMRGVYNATTPEPVRNAEFTKALGRALRRPTAFPVPAVMLRLLFGEVANETVLASARLTPARLTAEGFEFQYPEITGALEHLMGGMKNKSTDGAHGHG